MNRILSVLLVAVLAMPATAATMTLPGSWNGWDVNGNVMTDNSDGTYTLALSGLAADTRYEFKVVQDADWGMSWPGANSWAYTDAAGAVTVSFDTNVVSDGWLTDQNRIGVDVDLGTWTVVGGFQGWDNANASTAMASVGGGIYEYTHVFPTAGTQDWKVVNTGSWDSISTDNRSINTANAQVTTTADNQAVTFRVDALTGVVQAEVIPEPASLALVGLAGLLLAARRRG